MDGFTVIFFFSILHLHSQFDSMIFKRIGSLCFALGFVMAIFVFTNIGMGLIPRHYAKTGMIVLGAIALLMNLLSFRYDSQSDSNILYWIGTVAIFCGITMKIMHWPFSMILIYSGIGIVGLSFFYNPFAKKDTTQEDELLDQ